MHGYNRLHNTNYTNTKDFLIGIYAHYKSTHKIAEVLGVSTVVVCRALRKRRIEIQNPGGWKNVSAQLKLKGKEYVREKSVTSLAEEYSVTKTRIRQIKKELCI